MGGAGEAVGDRVGAAVGDGAGVAMKELGGGRLCVPLLVPVKLVVLCVSSGV